jgi:abhydrolase domain-containing protein 14
MQIMMSRYNILYLLCTLLPFVKTAQELETGSIKFADIEAHYQLYDVPGDDVPVVLFLHGAKFTSKNWVDLGTLQLLQSNGFRTAAVDLPGFGQTRNLPYVDNNMRAEFLKTVFEYLGRGSNLTANGAALVSPSMSGKWAIPFLDRYGVMLKGWVPVAPAGVMQWGGPWEYTHKRVQLLAVYGEHDEMKEEADDLMKLFSNSDKVIIPESGHACYMEKTDTFHVHLKNFLIKALARAKKEL